MTHNWDYKPIGDCFVYIKNGANISQAKDSGGIPITRIETLSNGLFNRSKMGYANILEPGKYAQNVLNDGDLLMSHINSKSYIGRTVMYEALPNEVIIHGMNLLRLVPNETTLSKFFYYFTLSHYFKSKIVKIRKDAVNQSSFSITDLKKINIPVPPLAEQQQIVAELDKINETIEDCRELLRNLDALAQSLFCDFFGDPAINPKGWRIYKIKDICSVNPTKREIRIPTSSEISFLPMEDLPINARYFTPIKVKTLNEVQNSYTYFSGEDVLFAKVTPCFENGKAGIPVNLINNIGFGSSELFVLRPNFQIINREYIYSFIRTNHFVSEAIKKLSGTSGLRRVPRTVVENFQIPVPPLELQEKFAARMEEIEAQKKTVESTIAELQTLLDSRMDYYFG